MKIIAIIGLVILIVVGGNVFVGWKSQKALKKAHQSLSEVAISQLTLACDDFYEEYQFLPLGSQSNKDTIHLTIGKMPPSLMMSLVGLSSPIEESTKHLPFFIFKAAVENRGGLLRTKNTAELFDPWGNPYHVLLDYDSDGKLKDPHTGKIIEGQRVLIWSPGPDKKSGTKDDICSWK